MSSEENINENTTESEANNSTAVAEPSLDLMILEEMTKVGVLYGRKKSKTHPRMKSFIFTTRNGVEIFDLPRVFAAIEKAQEFLRGIAKKGGLIMFVSTLPSSKELIASLGKKFGFPYVTERWLGGTLTNFKTLSDRTRYYMNLKADKETGKLAKYTKKEQTQFGKEIERLTVLFNGLETLNKLPDALIVVDAIEHETAVREAKRLKIPVVALINSDTNPETISYPIPGNSMAKSSVAWVLNKLEESISAGIKDKETAKEVKEAAKEPTK
ncbi:MAG: 30S ribosomal protein S2 [Patescibacteria group bacterium]